MTVMAWPLQVPYYNFIGIIDLDSMVYLIQIPAIFAVPHIIAPSSRLQTRPALGAEISPFGLVEKGIT